MYDIITIGSAALRDFTFFIDSKKKKKNFICLPQGTKINVDQSYFTHGGGACNVAVGLSNFGLKIASIVRVGKDYSGQAIIDGLKKRKIDTRFIQIDKKLHTGVSAIIQPRGGDRIILTYRGANDNLEIKTDQLKKIKTKWFYLSTFSGKWGQSLDKIFKLKKISLPGSSKKPIPKIAWNPSVIQLEAGQKKLAKFLHQTDLLILNRKESALLTGQSERKIPLLLKSLNKLGPEMVVITCGKDGAYLMDRNKIFYQSAKAKKVIDTTGAGDSFASGFLAGLILFNDSNKALKIGVYNSAATISKIGAQDGLLFKKDLKKIKV